MDGQEGGEADRGSDLPVATLEPSSQGGPVAKPS